MNILIKDIDVIPVDGIKPLIENTNIYIGGNTISHIGDLRDDLPVDRIISGKNKVCMPGLINAHTHIGMSLFRNYADDLPLQEWLNDKIWPAEAKLTDEDIYWGSLLSIVEMIEGGTTTFCDMYFALDHIGMAIEESGIRGMMTRGITAITGGAYEKLEETEDLHTRWHKAADDRIRIMVAPHAPYTCDVEFLKASKELAERLGTGIHIHLSETKGEVEDSIRNHNMTPIELMNEIGLFDVHTIAAHCVHVNERDMDILKEKNVYPVNCPGSNLKLASGFAPVDQMMKKGIGVSLGTDGSSSNNNLNMFEEMNLAAIVNKAVNLDALSITADQAIEMATINGARALAWSDKIGSIEVGKCADIILIDLDKSHHYPKHNISSSVAYSTQASDVDTVIINGDIIMENRKILTLDVEKIKTMAEKSAKDLLNRE